MVRVIMCELTPLNRLCIVVSYLNLSFRLCSSWFVVKQNHPVMSNEWHFSTWGDGGQYGAGNGGTAGEEQVGGG